MSEQDQKDDVERHAISVAVLAFRCARQVDTERDMACAQALKAYLAHNPDDREASNSVIDAIVEAVKLRPHWLTGEKAEADPDS